jgi:hypothetical protein
MASTSFFEEASVHHYSIELIDTAKHQSPAYGKKGKRKHQTHMRELNN